jgi:hypothetical protein
MHAVEATRAVHRRMNPLGTPTHRGTSNLQTQWLLQEGSNTGKTGPTGQAPLPPFKNNNGHILGTRFTGTQ